jgi:hypothetical protein
MTARDERVVRVVPGATLDRERQAGDGGLELRAGGAGAILIPKSGSRYASDWRSPPFPRPTVLTDVCMSSVDLLDDLSRHRGIFKVLAMLNDHSLHFGAGVSRYQMHRALGVSQGAINGALECASRHGLALATRDAGFPFGTRYRLTARGAVFTDNLSRA